MSEKSLVAAGVDVGVQFPEITRKPFIVVVLRILLSDSDRLIVVGSGFPVFVLLSPRSTTKAIDACIIRVKLKSLGVVCDGLSVFAFAGPGSATAEESVNMRRIQPDGIFQILTVHLTRGALGIIRELVGVSSPSSTVRSLGRISKRLMVS